MDIKETSPNEAFAFQKKNPHQIVNESKIRAKEHAENVELRWKVERTNETKESKKRIVFWVFIVFYLIVVIISGYYLFSDAPKWAIGIAILQILTLIDIAARKK